MEKPRAGKVVHISAHCHSRNDETGGSGWSEKKPASELSPSTVDSKEPLGMQVRLCPGALLAPRGPVYSVFFFYCDQIPDKRQLVEEFIMTQDVRRQSILLGSQGSKTSRRLWLQEHEAAYRCLGGSGRQGKDTGHRQATEPQGPWA